jgi:hypothetical protein
MDEMDYWRLCDELNVVQAALLVVGEAPTLAGYIEGWDIDKRPKGYEAAKTAIAHALKKYYEYSNEVDRSNGINSFPYEPDQQYLEALRARSIVGELFPLYESDINGNQSYPIAGTVDFLRSTVEVESLKQWLKHRGFSTGFFFPAGSGDAPDYLDPQNPRYAPKLAAAVHAWLAVTDSGKKSPKQALEKWLRENAARFGLVDDDGNPVNQAVEDCSKVANWNQSGGAPKTPS